MYLLDAALQAVAVGQTGELFIGGAGVARAYLHRPGLSAERFLPDPFAAPGSRMYRSGDLARRRLDGELEYLGRADQQVKIRGYRIELGEIEAALMAHEAVQNAIVLALADGSGTQRLFAWLTAKEPSAARPTDSSNNALRLEPPPLSEAALRQWLQSRLPQHMLPAAMLWLHKIPLTNNGKLDRAALPMPELAASRVRQTEATGLAHTATEASLVGIWQEVLGSGAVGPEDNFFALGGDSITALRLVAAAREAGMEISLAQIFRVANLAQLAAEVDAQVALQADTQADTQALAGVEGTQLQAQLQTQSQAADLPVELERAFPIASLQAGMLFHSELEEGSSVFLDVFSYQLRMQWDKPRFANALARLAADVAALRTGFDWQHGTSPAQIVFHQVKLPLEVIDLRGIDAAKQSSMIEAFLLAERGRLFDISTAPLMRFTVHLLDAEKLRLNCSLHHAIVDGWSFATLITRLLSNYLQPELALPPSPSLQEMHVWREREATNDPAMRAFWRDYLAAIEPRQDFARLPSDEQKAPVGCRIPIDSGLLAAARQLAQKAHVSLKTVLLGAHILALAEITGSDSVCTGYVAHCRPEVAQAENAIGLFLNTLPLAVAVNPDVTLFQWIQSLAQEETRVLAQRWMPLMEIKKMNRAELPFSSSFNFVNFHAYQQLFGYAELEIESLEVFEQTDFPLLAQFGIDPRDQGLELTLFAQCAAIDWDELNRMALVYVACLAVVVGADPELIQDETIAHSSKLAQDTLQLSRALLPPELQNVARQPEPESASAPLAGQEAAQDEQNQPWSKLELALLPLWQSSLCCQQIGRQDSFFALGGDSISGTRLVTQVRTQFACQLPLRIFLQTPTIAGMAAAMAAMPAMATDAQAEKAEQVGQTAQTEPAVPKAAVRIPKARRELSS